MSLRPAHRAAPTSGWGTLDSEQIRDGKNGNPISGEDFVTPQRVWRLEVYTTDPPTRDAEGNFAYEEEEPPYEVTEIARWLVEKQTSPWTRKRVRNEDVVLCIEEANKRGARLSLPALAPLPGAAPTIGPRDNDPLTERRRDLLRGPPVAQRRGVAPVLRRESTNVVSLRAYQRPLNDTEREWLSSQDAMRASAPPGTAAPVYVLTRRFFVWTPQPTTLFDVLGSPQRAQRGLMYRISGLKEAMQTNVADLRHVAFVGDDNALRVVYGLPRRAVQVPWDTGRGPAEMKTYVAVTLSLTVSGPPVPVLMMKRLLDDHHQDLRNAVSHPYVQVSVSAWLGGIYYRADAAPLAFVGGLPPEYHLVSISRNENVEDAALSGQGMPEPPVEAPEGSFL